MISGFIILKWDLRINSGVIIEVFGRKVIPELSKIKEGAMI
jgi:hypothetical protein